jgi:predicted nucleic acid-binding protein
MNAKAFFDTNILIYSLQQDEPKAEVAARLLAAGGRVSVQVLNEFVDVARRKLGMPWPDVIEALAVIRQLCGSPLPITEDIHQAAVEIASRHAYAIWDALIIATAISSGCESLYSEDMQHGRRFAGRVEVVNPFLAPPWRPA